MDDPNNQSEEQPPTNAEGGEEMVPATQFSQEENEEEDSSSPQNLEEGAPSNNEEPETPNPRIFATPGKPPNQQRDNLEDADNMDEEDEEMVAETPHFNRNQQGKLIIVLP